MATGGSVCHYYNTSRGCWNGDSCRFIHDNGTESNVKANLKTRRCRYYRLPSGCRFGDACSFRHDDQGTRSKMELVDLSCQMKSLTVYDEKHTWEGLEKETSSLRNDPDYSHDTPGAGADYRGTGEDEKYEENGDNHDDDDDDDDEEEEEEEEEKSDDDRTRRLEKWKAEKEDEQKPEINKAICGECGAMFQGEEAFDMLSTHYLEKFRKFDFKHLKFLSEDPRFEEITTCIICERAFQRSKDLLRHTVDKSKREDQDGAEHKLLVERGLVQPFVYRDTVYHDDDRMREELVLTLHNDPLSESGCGLGFMDLIRFGLIVGAGGGGRKGGRDDDDDDDDDDSDDSSYGGMFGFSASDCEELLCQGVKPWDDDAADVLAVLNGWY